MPPAPSDRKVKNKNKVQKNQSTPRTTILEKDELPNVTPNGIPSGNVIGSLEEPTQKVSPSLDESTTQNVMATLLNSSNHVTKIPDGDQVVISGISGRWPESDNMEEFAQNLYKKIDMVTENDRRWRPGQLGLPKRHGKLKDISKFDAQFFGVTPKQAEVMDPQLRILLEATHEAIVDAGINPLNLRGQKVGVFIGASSSETESFGLSGDPDRISGYTLMGATRSMYANRVSYCFDFRGPSFALDTACSSSLLALHLALDNIRLGNCEAAIVGGSMLSLMPWNRLTLYRLGIMSDEGICRTFDAEAKGYASAETVAVCFIQKKNNCNRLYCTVVHAKSNADGYKSSGITMPSGDNQAELLKEVYEESGVSPSEVAYFEAHGTGTMIGDPQECNAIHKIMCQDRVNPLLIGSVKSNIGHAEPASGVAALAKVVLAAHNNLIPPNLHYKEPNPYIAGLIDGSMQVVTEPTPWEGGYMGINSFGFGGANTHILIKSNDGAREEDVPLTFNKLICYSAPTPAAIDKMFDAVEKYAQKPAFHALVSQQACSGGISDHNCRGFIILQPDGSGKPAFRQFSKLETTCNRPVWFIYTGMGAQWAGMGSKLVQIDLFRNTLKKLSDSLKPLGMDLYDVIVNANEETYKSTLNSMVGNCALQICLTDLLTAVGMEPAGIIGHSTGEIAAGYADGCLTAEQAIQCAYYRAKAVSDAKLIGNGAMAAVGLSWEEAAELCVPGVVPACHNAKDSVTISGTSEKVEEMVAKIKSMGKFAKRVDSTGVAFHSPLMRQTEGSMFTALRKVIPSPKPRSKRWISTCFTKDQMDSEVAKSCSAAYQVQNAMHPVLFHDAVQKVPQNAICIEIAPHALLQAILKRSLPSSVINIGLLKANHENEHNLLLKSFGMMHLNGLTVKTENLYPPVKFPVPPGTPMLGPLMDWDHKTQWNVLTFNSLPLRSACQFTIEPFAPDSPDYFLTNHLIDDRNLFPFVGYVMLAWKGLLKINMLDWDDENPPPVLIQEFEVLRPVTVAKKMLFDIVRSPGKPLIEIFNNRELVARGNIEFCETRAEKPFLHDMNERYQEFLAMSREEFEDCEMLNQTDVYKLLSIRGYDHKNEFQCLHSYSIPAQRGYVHVSDIGSWLTVMEVFLQHGILAHKPYDRTLYLPNRIRSLRIDPESHKKCIETLDDGKKVIRLFGEIRTNSSIVGGIEVFDIKAGMTSRRSSPNNTLHLETAIWCANEDFNVLQNEDFAPIRAKIHTHNEKIGKLLSTIWSSAESSWKRQFAEIGDQLDIVVKKYLPLTGDDLEKMTSTLPSNQPLLKLLDQLRHNPSLSMTEFGSSFANLNEDISYGGACFGRLLCAQMNLIQMNIPGIKCRFCVVEPMELHMTQITNDGKKVIRLFGEIRTNSSIVGGIEVFDIKAGMTSRRSSPNNTLHLETAIWCANEDFNVLQNEDFAPIRAKIHTHNEKIGKLLSTIWSSAESSWKRQFAEIGDQLDIVVKKYLPLTGDDLEKMTSTLPSNQPLLKLLDQLRHNPSLSMVD